MRPSTGEVESTYTTSEDDFYDPDEPYNMLPPSIEIPKKRKKRAKKHEIPVNPYYNAMCPSMYSTFKKKFSNNTVKNNNHN